MFSYLELAPLMIAFGVAFVMLLVMTPIAHQWGLVDQPCCRKQHTGLVPLTGGFAMFVAILVSSFLTDVWLKNDPLFFTAAAFIVLLGMLDDRFNLSAKGRLICQFGVAAIMAWAAQNYITSLGNITGFGDANLGAFGYIFTLVCVVGVINAFNMIDGIDGLAGGMSLIVLISLSFLLLIVGQGASIMAPMIVIAALIPFLAFNLNIKGFKGNKIFMGDSGSMFIGLTIVWLLVEFTQGQEAQIRPITAVWLIGLPLMDMAAIMYRRARKGQSVLQPDRQHLHNIFMRAGCSSNQALIGILVIGAIFALIGIVGEIFAVSEAYMFWGFIGLLFIYSVIIQNVWKVLRFFKSKILT
ncbi:UDP-N-acetylglucosamine--undecaprenyl-phosphate N-acetylglucosaminephosphotransferase [Alteromonas sp. 5E99-2]|uniref:UDP-N-acetylglucosamine--undecaprenyl-phosphate N-acetylglucosaminephosphotransferase n=1 Tax=Alteromonas sp. 5E99-2 TaxID=2817683 RepID=UPI001A98E3C0|nr:UDP-N-acetylglucosamine--undecaprenyl-phosphate N-acetylglucosaminephosphotransferase [Alteromonas sp. 5E99-2]MBO1254154.1 UDP-N-acetylglucosamine--undecaprenyl-phosphate N-acetylglucosaminephosphotransferase [Alteromonas sp. 5E99-2]